MWIIIKKFLHRYKRKPSKASNSFAGEVRLLLAQINMSQSKVMLSMHVWELIIQEENHTRRVGLTVGDCGGLGSLSEIGCEGPLRL